MSGKGGDKKAVKLKVQAKDPAKDENLEPKAPAVLSKDENNGQPAEESEEDRLLREKLEAAVRKLIHTPKDNMKIFTVAVDTLTREIQTATGSMTSVPKPLKYLRPFYTDLKTFYLTHKKLDKVFVKRLADVMSVLAMTMAEEGSREMLKFKLEGNSTELGIWGHEFVRALCGEISQEYASLSDEANASNAASKKDELKQLSRNIIPFLIHQNTETEAVDLLFEIEDLDFFLKSNFIDKTNYERTCLYLTKFAEYLFNLEDLNTVLNTTFELYMRCDDLPNALRIALKLNDKEKVRIAFEAKYGDTPQDDLTMKKQLGYLMGCQKNFSYDPDDADVGECINNEALYTHFQTLGQNLNVQEAKSPEDVYKTHLYDNFAKEKSAQSSSKNLAATYVNAFVNCGFEHDSLLEKKEKKEGEEDEANWVFKNKEKGKVAAVASLGMICLWSPNVGSNLVNEWLDAEQTDAHCFAGGLLGLGVTSCGINGSSDIALALVEEAMSNEGDTRKDLKIVKVCAALGIALAFAGSPNEGALAFLQELIGDADIVVKSFAALAIGFMYVGTGDSAAASEISVNFFSDPEDLESPVARFLILGWALIYLGKQNLEDDEQREAMEAQLDAVKAMECPQLAKFGQVAFDACAYAGSGNVIQVQNMLHLCAEHLDEAGLTQEEAEELKAAEDENAEVKMEEDDNEENNEEKDGEAKEPENENEPAEPEVNKEKAAVNAVRQAMAVLGVALITFGDPVGKQMAERSFQHLLQYGDLAIRRAVPLAMAMIRVSDPEYGQIDILSKLTHDSDTPTAMSAIMSLGIMASGTTNSRVAQLLRQLAVFYKNEADVLLVVRLAQGLLFAGKGLVTLHPFHSDRTLMSPTAVAALLSVMVASLDMSSTILADYHVLMYTLAAAMRPRMCMTLLQTDEGLEHVKVKVRVGQAVETVGQAGNPKKITGFQTQETPVLLNVGDRVELATDEYEAYTNVLEGIVVLKKTGKQDEE